MTTWKRPQSGPDNSAEPALFLDRDGVVIAQEHYLADPGQVRLLPGVAEAMARARSAGFLLIGVSNQSGIGRGYFGEDDLHRVMLRLEELLAQEGIGFDSFHYCPHAPDANCPCRKPRLGMLDEAQAAHGIDLSRSWAVGDKNSDVAFGRAAGMGGILVRTGYGAAEEKTVTARFGQDPLVRVADDLAAAVELILGLDREGARL